VVCGVFFEVFAEVGPATANAHHDALPMLTDAADKELDGGFAVGARKVIELDLLVAALVAWS
jgi:hypothetical protein